MDIALALLQHTPITGPETGDVFAEVFIAMLGVLMVIIVALFLVHEHRKGRGGLPGLLGPWMARRIPSRRAKPPASERLEGSPPAGATESEEPPPR